MTKEGHPKNKVEQLKEMLAGRSQGKEEKPEPEKEDSISTEASELEALQKELQTAQEEAKQNYEKLLRTAADFENYKKRIAKDHEERTRFSNEALIRELIPVLDDLDRILNHLPENPSPEFQTFIEGAEIVKRHFLAALQKYGVAPVETMGKPFDPHYHEAMNHVESQDLSPGTIAEEHRKGYLLHQRLLRPAWVSVVQGKNK